MSNVISFVGRIGQDPELKTVGQSQVLEFSIANNVGYGDRKSTNWFRCTCWGARATTLKQYLSKGKQVFITGELVLRKYTANDASEKMSPEIKVQELDFVGDKDDSVKPSTPAAQNPEASAETGESLPF